MNNSAWLLPNEEKIPLIDNSKHSMIVTKFLSGLISADKELASWCFNEFQRFSSRKDYVNLPKEDVLEEYAIICLRWVKIGNAYNYNNNCTITVAQYDSFGELIEHYQDIGYSVCTIPIIIHYPISISYNEYDNINVKDVIKNGTENYDEYVKMFNEMK